MPVSMRIGVDFGGAKIEAAALTADGGFAACLRQPNPGTYDAAIATVAGLIARVEAEAGADRWQGRIVPARWDDSSGVRGAAWLWDAAG